MATYLLKKSYRLKDLKEIKFDDLWGGKGVFTTMRIVGKKPKIILLNKHISNLLNSLKKYNIKDIDIESKILNLIKINLKLKNYNHLLRIALTKRVISLSLRKRIKPKKNFKLKILFYKRIDPEYKNLYYKKIVKYMSQLNLNSYDVGLCHRGEIVETGTSNIIFSKQNRLFSPRNNCYIGNTIKYLRKKIEIKFENIFIKDLDLYDEILLVGSGKGVTSVAEIKKFNWKRRSNLNFKKLNKIYERLI